MKRLYMLQDFRAMAAIIVVLLHATDHFHRYFNYTFLNGVFKSGDMGVDIFFVISGFIMYYIHNKHIGQRDQVGTFLYKRLTRIYPIYWIVTIALIPVYFLNPSFGQGYETNLDVIVKSILLIPQGHQPILVVAWSLSYELLFYILFCLFLLFNQRKATVILGTWAAIILILMLLPYDKGLLLGFLFNPLNLEFLMGVIIAHLHLKAKVKQPRLILGAGVLLTVVSWYLHSDAVAIHRVFLYGIPSFLLILGAVTINKEKKTILTKLGDASYSLYLIHYPILSVINKIFLKLHVYQIAGYFVAFVVTIAITITIGYLFYLFVEKPTLSAFAKFRVFKSHSYNAKAEA